MSRKYSEYLRKLPQKLKKSKWIMILTKPFIPSFLLLLSFDVFSALLGVGSTVASKYVIDSAAASSSMSGSILLLVLVTALGLALGIAASLIVTVINEKYSFHIRQKLFDRVLRSSWLEVAKYHSGDLLTRLKSDVGAVTNGISNLVPSIITLVVRLIAAFFTLWYFDRMLACFALILGPISLFFSMILGSRLKYMQKKVQESESKYSAFIQESLENIMIIKSFASEEKSSDRLRALYQERVRWILKRNRISVLASGSVSLFFSAGYLMAFIWGATKLSLGLITYGTMTVFLSLITQVQGPVISLARTIPQIVSVLASAERITELHDLEPEPPYSDIDDKPISVGLRAENIEFAYHDDNVLEQIDLDISPGDMVAILGPSGIGKTTLVRIIMSLVKPRNGRLNFYNNEGFLLNTGPSARHIIAYVPQGNTLFSGTIRDNLAMGNNDATQKEMNEALEVAAAEFVFELPDGIDTVIGEKGHSLSEGQAQRIAIARAIIRKAPMLILDEATSSLDEATELNVLKNISSLVHKPTCIIITHRKSILAFCNRQIAIEDGKTRELNLEASNLK